MRIERIKITDFRRFDDLEVSNIPSSAKLVVLCGANGVGKSAFLDAILFGYRTNANYGIFYDDKYFPKKENSEPNNNKVNMSFFGHLSVPRDSVYVRTAYRHDPDFSSEAIVRSKYSSQDEKIHRMIDTDSRVSENYSRLVSGALEDLFVKSSPDLTFGEYRFEILEKIRKPMKVLFPDLDFIGLGNPFNGGSFLFSKGNSIGFDYRNLSAGERAAFNLILDIVIKVASNADALFCIDEPELHINARIQGPLLRELLSIIPDNSQLWIASHSVGMMRTARDMYYEDPSTVAFFDFDGVDFDNPVQISPVLPTKKFWQRILNVAVDDLASLVAPETVVLCEGSPSGNGGKNSEFDARIYNSIFSNGIPEALFVSVGSSTQVSGDFFGLATALPKIIAGIKIIRLIDRDDNGGYELEEFNKKGIKVLNRRSIESYLYDDEIIVRLCFSMGRGDLADGALEIKRTAINNSVSRGNAADDYKSASNEIYINIKTLLGMNAVGSGATGFAVNKLASLIVPETSVYQELKSEIFG